MRSLTDPAQSVTQNTAKGRPPAENSADLSNRVYSCGGRRKESTRDKAKASSRKQKTRRYREHAARQQKPRHGLLLCFLPIGIARQGFKLLGRNARVITRIISKNTKPKPPPRLSLRDPKTMNDPPHVTSVISHTNQRRCQCVPDRALEV